MLRVVFVVVIQFIEFPQGIQRACRTEGVDASARISYLQISIFIPTRNVFQLHAIRNAIPSREKFDQLRESIDGFQTRIDVCDTFHSMPAIRLCTHTHHRLRDPFVFAKQFISIIMCSVAATTAVLSLISETPVFVCSADNESDSNNSQQCVRRIYVPKRDSNTFCRITK